MAMEEDGKATLLNTAQVDGRTHYSYRTVAGDVFTVVWPDIDPEMEKAVRAMLVEVMEEDNTA